MQPNQEPSDWQQPTEQPSRAPYVAIPDETQQLTSPVTMSPEATTNTVREQTLAGPEQATVPPSDQPVAATVEPVRWQATEYIQRDKSPIWFIVFAVVVIFFIIIAIFLIKSITFAILIPVMAAATVVYAYRPPRLMDYTLSAKGLYINDRLYPFAEFKAFGVVHDIDEYSIMLIPTKRFKPGVSVYFPEEAGEAIVDMLGARLPMNKLHLDIIDKLIRKLRI